MTDLKRTFQKENTFLENEFKKITQRNVAEAMEFEIEDFIDVMAQDRPEMIDRVQKFFHEEFKDLEFLIEVVDSKIEEVKMDIDCESIKRSASNNGRDKDVIRKMSTHSMDPF
jgi:flagella basal body P-ring formation protein FlgA